MINLAQFPNFVRGLILFVLVLPFFPSNANALIYDYKYFGNSFGIFTGMGCPYTTSDHVTIDIQSNGMLTASEVQSPNVISFVMSDGLQILSLNTSSVTTSNIQIFSISPSGLPTSWEVYLNTNYRANYGGIESFNIVGSQPIEQ